MNISNKSVWVDRQTIDRVADVLARSGCNMVRFEALDSIGGFLDVPGSTSSRKIDPDKLPILDYWISRLRERGIYYYLNLLDFRQFKEGDEVKKDDLLAEIENQPSFTQLPHFQGLFPGTERPVVTGVWDYYALRARDPVAQG